jgi:hypothetical protein
MLPAERKVVTIILAVKFVVLAKLYVDTAERHILKSHTNGCDGKKLYQ